MTDSSQRQEGRTTNQMLKAPIGAVYVWCNGDLYYPKQLARRLGREDLKVVPPSWFDPINVLKQRLTGLVVDHATSPHAPGRYEAMMLAFSREIPDTK